MVSVSLKPLVGKSAKYDNLLNGIFTFLVTQTLNCSSRNVRLRLDRMSGATFHRAGEKHSTKWRRYNVEAFPEERRRRHRD